MYHYVFGFEVAVDQAQLVEVADGVHQLLEDYGGLVLVQEDVLLYVLEEVALVQVLRYDVRVAFGLELVVEFYYVRVVA
jgi:hypothetical protein